MSWPFFFFEIEVIFYFPYQLIIIFVATLNCWLALTQKFCVQNCTGISRYGIFSKWKNHTYTFFPKHRLKMHHESSLKIRISIIAVWTETNKFFRTRLSQFTWPCSSKCFKTSAGSQLSQTQCGSAIRAWPTAGCSGLSSCPRPVMGQYNVCRKL